MNTIFKSSANADKLALTIKGILMGLVPVIIIVLSVLGINLGTEALTDLVTQITAIVAGIVTLYGLGRKIYFTIKALFTK